MKVGDYVIFKKSSYTGYIGVSGTVGRIVSFANDDDTVSIKHSKIDNRRGHELFHIDEIQLIDITTLSELERLFLDFELKS